MHMVDNSRYIVKYLEWRVKNPKDTDQDQHISFSKSSIRWMVRNLTLKMTEREMS